MKKKEAKRAFGQFSFALALIGVIGTLMQWVVGVFYRQMLQTGIVSVEDSWVRWILSFLPLYGIGIPLGMVWIRKIPAENLLLRTFTAYDSKTDTRTVYKTTKKFGKKDFVIMLLICFPVMQAGNILGMLMSYLFSGGMAQNPLTDMVNDTSILKMLVVVVLGPWMEEYLFRKQIIDRCGRYGEKVTILFSGLVFGLFHGNLYQFFYAFGIGVIFAYVYTRTGKLRYSVEMHMILNFMGGVVAPWILKISGLDFNSTSAQMQVMMHSSWGMRIYMGYMMLYMGATIAGLVLLITRWSHTYFLPAPEELMKGEKVGTIYFNVGFFALLCYCVVSIIYNLIAL